MADSSLALHGGRPILADPWPPWPVATPDVMNAVHQVLAGSRWSVTGPFSGTPPLDRELGRRLALLLGQAHCVVVDHGSSALLAALYALGVGPQDEVIVPALTWVACATAVCRVGAIPVLADVDNATLTVDPAAVEAAWTDRTRAVLAVHLYGSMVDVPSVAAVAERRGGVMIEDAAHVPGASWAGRPAGSFGTVSAISMQQGKVLTAGEGGAVATSDDTVAAALEAIRTDGRRYVGMAPIGEPDLVEVGVPTGWNMCLSEIQAAIALAALDELAVQHGERARGATLLDELLRDIEGVDPVAAYPANDERAYYHYALRVDPAAFAGRTASALGRALSAELGTWIHPPYPPLTANRLYQPHRSSLWLRHADAAEFDPGRFRAPVAETAHRTTLVLHHSMLCAGERHLAAVAEALVKVRHQAASIEFAT